MARPQAVSDDDILQAAREVFLEQGPAASTTAIAERLGVSQATLFKRFGTKDGLMLAALMPPAEPPFLPLLSEGPKPGDLRPQLVEIARTMGRFMDHMVPCMAMLRASGMDPQDVLARHPVPPPVLAHRALSAWFTRARERGQVRAVDPDAVAVALMGAIQARSFLRHITGGPDVGGSSESYATSLVELLWEGLRPPAPPAEPLGETC